MKEIRLSPCRVGGPRRKVRNIKKTPSQIIFNNTRYSIKPESAPDPILFENNLEHPIDDLLCVAV